MFRDMRRFRQQLDTAECERILREASRGTLAVSGDDGYPYAVPLNFVFDGGCLYFHSAKEGHKADAARACGKSSFCVLDGGELSDDGWSYYFNSVIVFGRLREITDDTEKEAKLRLLGNKYFPTREMTESDIAKNASRCTVFEFKIEHMTGKRVHER